MIATVTMNAEITVDVNLDMFDLEDIGLIRTEIEIAAEKVLKDEMPLDVQDAHVSNIKVFPMEQEHGE